MALQSVLYQEVKRDQQLKMASHRVLTSNSYRLPCIRKNLTRLEPYETRTLRAWFSNGDLEPFTS